MTKKQVLSTIIETLIGFRAYLIAIACTLLFLFIFTPLIVQGHSMDNSYHDKQILLGINTRLTSFKKGDVICAKNESIILIKRVIAAPGDTISIKDNVVYVNDKIIDEEKYIKEPMDTKDIDEITLSENEYFIMGDNRNDSDDSRRFGPIKHSQIVCRVLW